MENVEYTPIQIRHLIVTLYNSVKHKEIILKLIDKIPNNKKLYFDFKLKQCLISNSNEDEFKKIINDFHDECLNSDIISFINLEYLLNLKEPSSKDFELRNILSGEDESAKLNAILEYINNLTDQEKKRFVKKGLSR